MKKIYVALLLLLLLFTNSFAANEWRAGTGENTPLGTETASDIDTVVFQRITDPIDRLNSQFRRGAQITYSSASAVSVGIGEVTCQNSGGTIRKFRANTSATSVGWADIDTGSEASSTTYYVYAVADADATTFTCKISTNSTTPTGVTYYRRLGSFYNDSSSNITNISNDDSIKPQYYDSGWFAIATANSYAKTHNLGTTRTIGVVYFSDSSDGSSNVFTQYHFMEAGGAEFGIMLEDITVTTLNLVTADTYIARKLTTSTYTSYSSGYARIILIALE